MRHVAFQPIKTVVPVFTGTAAITVLAVPPPVSRLPYQPPLGDVRDYHANGRPNRPLCHYKA